MRKQVKFLTPVLAALMLGACSSEPEWVGVYEQCKETVESKSDEIKSIGAESGDEQAQAMAQSMGETAMKMAMEACEMIRKSCEEDADSPTCKAYVEQGKQQ